MSDERELERESEAVRSAYRKLPRIEPPPALDRAVLAKARAALAAQPEVRRRPRWLLPVGIAATAVLAIGVASRLGRDQADDRWPAGAPAPATQHEAPADRAAPVAPATTPVEPAAPPAGRTSSLDGLGASQSEAEKKRKADQATATPAAEEDLGKLRGAEGERADRLKDEDQRAANEVERRYAAPKAEGKLEKQAPIVAPLPAPEPMDAPAPASPPAKQAYAPAPAPPPAAAAAPKPFPGRDDAKSAKEQARSETAAPQALAEPTPAQPAKDAEAAAGGPPLERQSSKMLAAPESRARQQAQPDSSRAAATEQAAPVMNAPAAAKAEGGASVLGNTAPADVRSNASLTTITPAERERPQSWLAAIRRVLGGGDEAEARHELQRFVQRYPDYAVPDDLARLRE